MMSAKKTIFLITVPFLFTLSGCTKETNVDQNEAYTTWSSYLGDSGRSHFTTLNQITPQNVSQLQVAWRYEAQDWGQMQMNPLV